MGPAKTKTSMQELYAAPADWDAQRETITRLYLHEKRSLQEVMELMALEHNFLATCDPPSDLIPCPKGARESGARDPNDPWVPSKRY